MGYGDEIMASGHAYSKHKETGKKIKICDLAGNPRWSEMWEGLDYILHPVQAAETNDSEAIFNAPLTRPYHYYPEGMPLTKKGIKDRGYVEFSNWRARDHLGKIVFNDQELKLAETFRAQQFIFIEPNGGRLKNVNKDWGFENWKALVKAAPSYNWAQFVLPNEPRLEGVHLINADSFRNACAILSTARAAVFTEGGLHHAAGILHKPAVVLFGGFTSPVNTGYPWHTNIYHDGIESPCGQFAKECEHCRVIWKTISPMYVKRKLDELLEIEAERKI